MAMKASVNELINATKKTATDSEIKKYGKAIGMLPTQMDWSVATTGADREALLAAARAHEEAELKRLANEKVLREAAAAVDLDGDAVPNAGRTRDLTGAEQGRIRDASKGLRIVNKSLLERSARGACAHDPSFPRLFELINRDLRGALKLIQDGKAPGDEQQDEYGVSG